MAGDQDRISATIRTGDVSGQVAVGKDIRQEHYRDSERVEVTEQDRAEARALFETLKRQVTQEAPPDEQPAALERIDELEQAVTAESPKLSTVEYVRDWFGERMPRLAGAVTSVVLSPIVTKLVSAGGEVAAAELRRRLGA